jgi:hypothetical protein
MTRSFQSKPSKLQLICLVLPCAVLTVYCFLSKMAIASLCCFVMLALFVERLIHTRYELTDDGQLVISTGRFSRTRTIEVIKIERIEVIRVHFPITLIKSDGVLITYDSGRQTILSPSVPEEFCRALLKAKEEAEAKKEGK